MTTYPPAVLAVLTKWRDTAYDEDGKPQTCIVNADVRTLVAEIDRLMRENAELRKVLGNGSERSQ